MGLNFTIPKELIEQMDKQAVAMLSDADFTTDNMICYAVYTWNTMTEDQKNKKIQSQENGFYDWADQLERIGAIGVYHSNQIKNIDKLTKCTKHKKIGKSSDGNYTYYLSINPAANQQLIKLIRQIQPEITDMTPLDKLYAIQNTAGGNLGEFIMEDISGKSYTEKMFQNYELTMVNVFTTWCTPCINEIPDLEKLYQEMSDKGVNIVGIVLDALDASGNVNDEAVQKAELLAKRTNASYPFLIPDTGYLQGRLADINAVPETFFVDKNGTIVGENYSGSNSFEDWKTIVEAELDSLKGEGQ